MKKIITAVTAILGSISIIYYIVCGAVYSFTLSGLWIWLCFGLIMYLGCFWKYVFEPKIHKKYFRIYKIFKKICLTAFALFMMSFFVFEGFLISKWHSGYKHDDTKADAVIILGATVEYDKPGEALAQRIDRTYSIIVKNPDAVVIACGGLGEEDIITEAECIKRELCAMGIPESRILTEERSTSTAENFKYAAELLGRGTKSVAVVTSGFHQFRALKIGRAAFNACNLTETVLFPISSPCMSLQLPRNMVREFAAFTSDFFSGNVLLSKDTFSPKI